MAESMAVSAHLALINSIPRNNPPGRDFAPPRFIAAQLQSAPDVLPCPLALVALPHVPQFGSHFGLNLITKQDVDRSEQLFRKHYGRVLHIPIMSHWPRSREVTPAGSQEVVLSGSRAVAPILWGYYVIEGEAETVPIVRPRLVPSDESLLDSIGIEMPRRWLPRRREELIQELGINTAVQVLSDDIFALLWYVNRPALDDPDSLNCLYPREWKALNCTIFGTRIHTIALPVAYPIFRKA
ncbi:hypothetical protein GGR52DRAFT_571550 [Hypoxylon sp. FL1284]|nr:hypothetical protein GGR52DRAFT_571550 [Hypoxylon sp. FL1284]